MRIPFGPGPVVGMPVRMDPGKDNQYLSRNYADSIAASGGTPVLIPLLKDPGVLKAIVRLLDGILLTGSNADVEPSLYGSEREPACGPAQPLRDQTDFFLLEAASAHRIPVLAICFGIQSLNVFMGGTLIQDIPTRLGLAVRHSEPRARFAHPVEFAPGSVLNALAGSTGARVNSTHHQCVDRVGGGLQVVAAAQDGVIEAVVGTAPEQWILGVQWHPEKSFAHDELSRRIFGTFIDHCRTRRAVDEGSYPEAARASR
jgi:putative glutamine amidotransferase